jgi:hypothetical protein
MCRFGAGYRSPLNGNDLDITGGGKTLNRAGICRQIEGVKRLTSQKGKTFVRESKEASIQGGKIYRSSSCPRLRSPQPCVAGAWPGDRLVGLCRAARDN